MDRDKIYCYINELDKQFDEQIYKQIDWGIDRRLHRVFYNQLCWHLYRPLYRQFNLIIDQFIEDISNE
jgi:hypothetical protein